MSIAGHLLMLLRWTIFLKKSRSWCGYKSDYEDITMGLLFVPVGYETVIQSLQKVLDSGMWE